MHRFWQGVQQRVNKLNLTQRLVLNLVIVVIATLALSGLPASLTLWRQLERQVWLRVEDAQAATGALYDAERTRLKKLAALIAERPTLYRLVQAADEASLNAYLQVLKEGANVDALMVLTPNLQAGDDILGLPEPQVFLAGNEPYYADYLSLDNPARFFILAVSKIQPGDEDSPLDGWVLMARELKAQDMRNLAEQTGLAQSLIVDGQRVAHSLSDPPAELPGPDALTALETASQFCCTLGQNEHETYYIGLTELVNGQGGVVALSEVALPGGAMRRSMAVTTGISAGISLLVLTIGAVFLYHQVRLITQPLEQLSEAAEQASLGNLEPPGLPHSTIPEINRLARHLDHARRQVRQVLAVTRSEMKYNERLLSSVREGVVALDDEGRVTYFNRDAEAILGCRAESVLHRAVVQIFPPAPGERTSLQDVLNKPPDSGRPQRLYVLDAEGHPLLLSITLSQPEPDLANGTPLERVLVIRDVTEEEAVNRIRYNFLANVAHEFRTPLAGIAATHEILVEEGSNLTPEELSALLETISLSTLHLQTLVDNLLESTTIEAGIFQVHRRPIQLLEVVQKAADLMKPLLKRRSQTLTLDAPEELPTLWADSNRLTQVLVNLLSNASKFSPMGGTIQLSITQHDQVLTVAVLDSGPGLPAGRYADLFNRFVTGSQPGETHYGIGLGLSVVKSIVEMHGGQVGAENRPEGGANVWFNIPIQPPQEKEDL